MLQVTLQFFRSDHIFSLLHSPKNSHTNHGPSPPSPPLSRWCVSGHVLRAVILPIAIVAVVGFPLPVPWPRQSGGGVQRDGGGSLEVARQWRQLGSGSLAGAAWRRRGGGGRAVAASNSMAVAAWWRSGGDGRAVAAHSATVAPAWLRYHAVEVVS